MYRITSFFLVLITAFSCLFNGYNPGTTAKTVTDYAAVKRDMEKYKGIYSRAGDCGGVPTLFINGEPFPSAAYMTYLEEYNRYEDFAGAGYRLFSVPVLFAGRWISSTEVYKPFHAGIFDKKPEPDFSTLDASINRILSACPDAYIFPRVNVSMPLWWIEENPECTDGTGKRELLMSEKFRETAAGMLKAVIEHINGSDYAAHIAGYQLAGGNTEEWFHFDLNAGCCKNAESIFNGWLEKYYPGSGFSGLPDLSLLKGKGPYHKNEHLARYLEFANSSVAQTVCYLCTVAKRETGGNVVAGAFYGYSLEVSSPLYGTHALKTVLECDNVDFICSPNSYYGIRDLSTDWTEMYPAASVRLHGKICMQECDIRTHLTKLLSECAPEYDKGKNMTAEIWHPLKNSEQSVAAIRKSFSRQLINGNGFWWFDMWGGWYSDPEILDDMKKFGEIYASSLKKENRGSVAEVAVFADESAYGYMTECGLRNTAFDRRRELGCMGAPYDYYDVSDFARVYGRYKAIIFLSDLKTPALEEALALCGKNNIKYISTSALKTEYSANELRAFCKSRGVHIYCETDDIVYINANYAAIHSTGAGTKKIRFASRCSYKELLVENGIEATGDALTVRMNANETRLFEITKL